MRFFDWLYSLVVRKRETAAPSAPLSLRAGGVPLFAATGDTALSVAAVYRCVRLLADSTANLPVQQMRRRGDIFEEDDSGSLPFLLNVQPNPTESAADFWARVVENILLDGNAYIVPTYNPVTLACERLDLCSRGTVSHDTTADRYYVSDTARGLQGTYPEECILHIKNISPDGKRGISVLHYARLTLDIASTGDRETLNRFANGGDVRGILSNNLDVRGLGEVQDEQLRLLAQKIDAGFRSGDRIIGMPGDINFKQLSLSSADMQFLQSRQFTVRDVCRFFGVHPSFVFDDTSNNYKSAEMANVAFLSTTLNPLLRKIECELRRKLLSPSLAMSRKFQFDRRGLYASDLASRVKYQNDTIAAGIYTVNEWRREENKPPVQGGDTVLVSANLRDISTPANNQAQ